MKSLIDFLIYPRPVHVSENVLTAINNQNVNMIAKWTEINRRNGNTSNSSFTCLQHLKEI